MLPHVIKLLLLKTMGLRLLTLYLLERNLAVSGCTKLSINRIAQLSGTRPA